MDMSNNKAKPSDEMHRTRKSMLAIAGQAWMMHPGEEGSSARVGYIQGFMRGEFGFELMLWLDGSHMNDAIKKLLNRAAPAQRPSEMQPFIWNPEQQRTRDDRRPANITAEPKMSPLVGGQAQQAMTSPNPKVASPAAPLTRADRRRQHAGRFYERYANLYLFKTLDGKAFHDCTAGELLKDADRRESQDNLERVTRRERRIALFERNLTLNLTSNTLIGQHYENREDLVVDAFNRAEEIHAE